MRCRNIKPSIYKNEQLAECSIPARWLFPGLWQIADWCGRLENRPKRIKMEIYPADSIEVEPLLCELESQGLILRYGAPAGSVQPYIWIPTFRKHQTPHQNERKNPSDIPPHPDDDQSDIAADMDRSRSAPGFVSSEYQSNPAESVIRDPESVIRDPESVIRDPGLPEPDGTDLRKRTGNGNGRPQHVASLLGPPGEHEMANPPPLNANRILAVTREPPRAGPYWDDTARRLREIGELSVLADAVRKAETDDGIREPAKFLNRQCSTALKAHGKRMPRSWKTA